MNGRWIIFDRVAEGTTSLARQLAAWLAAGEEKGKERAKTVLARLAGGVATVWFLGGIAYALGLLWWSLAATYLVSAIVAGGKPPATKPEAAKPDARNAPPAPAAPSSSERVQLLVALDEITARSGNIHLVHLWEQLRLHRAYADLADKELRALLVRHGVPIHQSVTAARVKGRSGIKRTDVEALLTPTPPPARAPLAAEEEPADQQQSSSSFPTGEGPEGVACTVQELGDDTLLMLRREVSGQ